MNPIGRREFMGVMGGLLLPWEQMRPSLILFNGNFYTMDDRLERAEAVAIAQGLFLAVGTNDDIRNLASANTRQFDLGGRTVVPGFIDAHSHPASAGLQHLRSVDCDLRSIAEIQAAIAKRAAASPPGEWVLGFKYDDTKTAEARFLTTKDLDDAAPRHPVYINHRGGHTAYVNSKALELAGVSSNTPDPPGGRFSREPESGRLTGRIEERATDVFEALFEKRPSRRQREQGVKLISEMMSRAGVTSVHDAYGSPADLQAYQDARDAGELSLRIYCLIGSYHLNRMMEAGVRSGFGDRWIRVGAIKMTCDGSISERTARLSQPYIGRPQDYGILVAGKEELYEPARKAHEAGWQIGIHANGDVAVEMVLDVYERLQREHPRPDPRFRIEHCTVINPTLVSRIKALRAIPNPFSTYVFYHGEKMREYGPERLESMFAVRSFLDAGIPVTMTSDYPPGPFEPMMALQSMVTRTDYRGTLWGPSQRITVPEALRVGTLNGAHASFEEDSKGSIQSGKLADLVVLGKDPVTVDPSQLIEIPVEQTMVEGRWVFEA